MTLDESARAKATLVEEALCNRLARRTLLYFQEVQFERCAEFIQWRKARKLCHEHWSLSTFLLEIYGNRWMDNQHVRDAYFKAIGARGSNE